MNEDNQNFNNNPYEAPVIEEHKENQKPKKSFPKRLGEWVILALCFGFVAGGTFIGTYKLGNHVLTTETYASTKSEDSITTKNDEKTKEENTTFSELSKTIINSNQSDSSVADIVENVMPSMVSVTISETVEYYNNLYGMFGLGDVSEYETKGSGSGIIVGENDEELLILTNEHVIRDANSVTIGFINGEDIEGVVKSYDEESDIAIISIPLESLSEDILSNIKIATLGNSNDLRLGESVIAIGNSLGYGQTVTTGVVSALEREIVDSENVSRKLIQTDAAINPGNSGGALINMKGEVIGINESKLADETIEGVGFAIPISDASNTIDELINRQTRTEVAEDERGYLGISCVDVSSDIEQMYGIPVGIFVSQVVSEDTKNAGLEERDIIIKFDGISVSSTSKLIDILKGYKKGEVVDVIVMRNENGNYVEKTLSIPLGDSISNKENKETKETKETNNDSNNQDKLTQDNFNFYKFFVNPFNFK